MILNNVLNTDADYMFNLKQLNQKAQYQIMKDCNNYKCYYVFNLIYSEIQQIDNCQNKGLYICNGEKMALIDTAEFGFILDCTRLDIRRLLQRLQDRGYIKQINLDDAMNNLETDFDKYIKDNIGKIRIEFPSKYGYSITQKGYDLINYSK